MEIKAMRTATRSIIAALAITASAWPRASDMTISGAAVLERASIARLTDVPSHNRLYRATLGLTSDSVWTLHLRSATGDPVQNASLVLEAWMPDDESVRRVVPIAKEYEDNGDYRVRRLSFTRVGWWNVRLQIAASGHVDSLAFNLVLG
jgi:hypothetical protein